MEIQTKYAGYIERELRAIQKASKLDDVKVPVRFDYEQIRALDPSNAKAWWQLGDLYETTHQWDKLAQALAKLVELTDDDEVKVAYVYTSQGSTSSSRIEPGVDGVVVAGVRAQHVGE